MITAEVRKGQAQSNVGKATETEPEATMVETIDELIERVFLNAEMGAVAELLATVRSQQERRIQR